MGNPDEPGKLGQSGMLGKWATTGNPARQRYNRQVTQVRQVGDVGKECSTKPISRQAKYDLLSSLPPRKEGLGKRDSYGEGKNTGRQTDRFENVFVWHICLPS